LKQREPGSPSLFAEGYAFGIGFWIASLVVNVVAGAVGVGIALALGVKL
jgi:hypothetical protein